MADGLASPLRAGRPAVLRSIRTYILGLAALFAILLTAAAAVLVREADAWGRAQTEAQLVDTTRALSQVVDARLGAYQRLLGALAASPSLRAGDFAALDRQARTALNEPDAWVMLSDRNGKQLVNTRLAPGSPLPTGQYPPNVLAALDTGEPRVCNLATGVVEKRILCVDWPIMADGRAEYVLSVIYRPRLLQGIIDAQRVSEGRYATILDRNGVVVWRNVRPDRFVGTPGTPDLLRLLSARREGTTESRSLEGTPTVVAFSRSERNGWTFIVAVPRAELAAGSRRALLGGALVSGLLLAGALLTAFAAARAVRREIAILGDGAQRIKDGEAPAFAPSRFAEFQTLSQLLTSAIAERDESRERFALAQEVGGIGSWSWDSLRDQGHVSDTYKEMHGLSHVRGPLRFSQVVETVHPEDRADYLARVDTALAAGDPASIEYRVLRPDGSVRWIVAKGRPIFSEDGRRIGSVGIVRDRTIEYEAEDTLHRLNELLERQVQERTLERDRLWNLARDPFVVADDKGVWLAASPAWTSLLGYPLEDFLGRTSEWLEHPDDAAKTRAENESLAAGNVTERFENRFRASDGRYKWLSWNSVPEGNRFYSVARDITREKEQAEALRKAEETLRQTQKMESIGQITGGVAHDFNNLLVPIVGTLDLLRQRGLPDSRAERMVGNAIEAAERARVLVQRLLAFARRQPLKAGAVDLAECFGNLEPLLATTLGPRVALEIDVPAGLRPVHADCNQLELAILNLAVNAKDAMPDGGRIRIAARLTTFVPNDREGPEPGRYVEVAVTDNGTGMPPQVVERAIEPFFSTKGLGRGTGLGLSMVHGLLAQLGGGLRIESTLGEGTTIRLFLREAGEAAATPAVEAAPPVGAAGAGRALVVDDEPLVLEGTAEIVAGLGYEVVQAGSAAEALDLLAEGSFDLLITDHLMPGMSGTELARAARTRWPAMHLLIVSGYADVDDIAPDLPRLAKPFRAAELAEALGRDLRSPAP
ncbi:PAS domain S-box protein [Sphingomonas parva]|uniref:histidine kinase n=1 Tax=Sphingomonas parva TaxID=2555898 RepID=A0A4Y8ZRF6_9SPHN|nr:PAS domain-containing protein [Sphingomonas parva]TFI58601.1 PAS domain S-box protein [Sphingomonas parva]